MPHGQHQVKRVSCFLCNRQCGLLLDVHDGRVERFKLNPRHPIRPDYRCERLGVTLDYHRHPDRLTQPLKRRGARGADSWEPISWEQALAEIAGKLGGLKAAYGPETLAVMGGTVHGPGDWAAWRFCNLFGTPNVFYQGKNCGEAEILTELAMYGYSTTSAGVRRGDSACVVVWGTNPAESMMQPGFDPLRAAKDRGAKIIVIDPRYTKTTALADLWLQLRPGTDGALALGLLHVIIKESLYDKEFVARWCLGFDKVAELAERYPPSRVADITWVPAERLEAAARLYATTKPACITRGSSTSHLGVAGRSCVHGKALLRALTGNLDVPGGDLLGEPYGSLGGVNLAWFETIQWDTLLNHPERHRDNVGAAEFPLGSVRAYRLFREAMAKVHPHGYGASVYHLVTNATAIWRAILERRPYPLTALIVQGGNPLVVLSGTRRTLEALRSPHLELFVVMDYFKTPTGVMADYLLPAADWLERPNLTTFWGMSSHIDAGERAVPPAAERRDDYQLWAGLGERLGQAGEWPVTLEGMYDRFLAPLGLTFEELLTQDEPWRFPAPRYRKYLEEGFATRSGKVELLPSIFADLGYAPLPEYEEPSFSPCRTPELARRYPLILIAGSKVRPYFHSQFRQMERLRRRFPYPCVELHPRTAAALGISEGAWVYVETPEGRVRLVASLTEGIDPRVVNAAGSWWYPEEEAAAPHLFGIWDCCINTVVPDAVELCDFAGDNLFRGLLCRVYPADGAAAPASANLESAPASKTQAENGC